MPVKDSAPVQITYFADPVCCWSYLMHGHLKQLEMDMSLDISYRMCGLIENWENYNDADNCVRRPIQMGPVWKHASAMTGMHLHDRIWYEDPPLSSFLACVAVKCVAMQNELLTPVYLQHLWVAFMHQGVNIDKQSALTYVAATLESEYPSLFSLQRFSSDLVNGRGMDLFRADLKEIMLYGISRFPAMIVTKGNARKLITGYRPLAVLQKELTGAS